MKMAASLVFLALLCPGRIAIAGAQGSASTVGIAQLAQGQGVAERGVIGLAKAAGIVLAGKSASDAMAYLQVLLDHGLIASRTFVRIAAALSREQLTCDELTFFLADLLNRKGPPPANVVVAQQQLSKAGVMLDLTCPLVSQVDIGRVLASAGGAIRGNYGTPASPTRP